MAAIGDKLCAVWEAMPQMTIALIEGYAVGAGLALSLACDWRVVASDAFVSLPEIALGIPLTWGAIPRLVNLVGPARATHLTLMCERFGAAQALEIGLIDHGCEPGQALARAQALASQTLAMPSAVARMSKESVNAIARALNRPAAASGDPAQRSKRRQRADQQRLVQHVDRQRPAPQRGQRRQDHRYATCQQRRPARQQPLASGQSPEHQA